MKQGDTIFVYGTLRPGERASLKDSRLVMHLGEDRINGLMYHLGYYPGITFEPGLFDPKLPIVVGDLFRIKDPSIILHLDAYEGYPRLYGRTKTITESGRQVWAYFYNQSLEGLEPMKIGDWVQYKNAIIPSEAA